MSQSNSWGPLPSLSGLPTSIHGTSTHPVAQAKKPELLGIPQRSHCQGLDSIPGQGTNIPQAAWCSGKKKMWSYHWPLSLIHTPQPILYPVLSTLTSKCPLKLTLLLITSSSTIPVLATITPWTTTIASGREGVSGETAIERAKGKGKRQQSNTFWVNSSCYQPPPPTIPISRTLAFHQGNEAGT